MFRRQVHRTGGTHPAEPSAEPNRRNHSAEPVYTAIRSTGNSIVNLVPFPISLST